jgi:hypothetical protein
VEHDERADECEACHTALRYWCRAHSREIGWLDSAECRRCAEDEARRRPRAPRPAPLPRAAAPSPAAPPAWRTVSAPLLAESIPPRAAFRRRRRRKKVPAAVEVKPRGPLWGLFEALLTIAGTGFAAWLLGMTVGGVLAIESGGDIESAVVEWGVLACGFGLALGLVLAIGNSTLYESGVYDSAEE